MIAVYLILKGGVNMVAVLVQVLVSGETLITYVDLDAFIRGE